MGVVTAPVQSGGHRGCILLIDATAEAGTVDMRPNVQIKAPSGAYVDYWKTGADITAVGKFQYMLYPGLTTVAGAPYQGVETGNFPVPAEWQFFMDHSDADEMTYSVDIHLLV